MNETNNKSDDNNLNVNNNNNNNNLNINDNDEKKVNNKIIQKIENIVDNEKIISVRGSLDRNILIIGKVGCGKSRLINISYSDNRAESRNTHMSVTKNCKIYTNTIETTKNIYNVKFIDTCGLADNSTDDEKILEQIVFFIRNQIVEVHYIFLIVKAGRMTKEEVDVLNKLIETFNLIKFRENVKLIFTHCDNWSLKTQQNYINELQKDEKFEKKYFKF